MPRGFAEDAAAGAVAAFGNSALPPFLAGVAGYLTRNVYVSYLTMAGFVMVAIAIYGVVINFQGRTLAEREIDILETVREPSDE